MPDSLQSFTWMKYGSLPTILQSSLSSISGTLPITLQSSGTVTGQVEHKLYNQWTFRADAQHSARALGVTTCRCNSVVAGRVKSCEVLKSRTFAKPETSVLGEPDSSFHGVTGVAADKMRSLPSGSARSSCRKVRKFEVSLGLKALQPMPASLGYSQLKQFN